MKYILVTGGVISGIGKGVISSSIGTILKCSGLSVTSIKIDPYLNIDAGTFNPYEHGEVFVLDDGGEVDLDLGNYERFLDITLHRDNNITTGKIYQKVIAAERRGDFLGKTVQVVPHVTDAIQEWVERTAQVPVSGDNRPPDVCVIELGGTIGDIEGMQFVEAFRQMQFRVGKNNFALVHVSLVIETNGGEHKTKPTQQNVRELRGLGLAPDIIACRSKTPFEDPIRKKISAHCHVPENHVINVYDCTSLYRVPLLLGGMLDILKAQLELSMMRSETRLLRKWTELADRSDRTMDKVEICLVGKYTRLGDAYASVIKALEHAALTCSHKLMLSLVEADDLEQEILHTDPTRYHSAWHKLCSAKGVLIPGGFGQRGTEGKIAAITWCRTKKVPMLGICLGFQMAVIEFARNVAGLPDAKSGESDAKSDHVVIMDMPEHNQGQLGGTMLLGSRKFLFTQKCKLRSLYGEVDSASERHRHRYEVSPDYAKQLKDAGMNFIATSEDGTRMEAFELPDHPYFVGVQYHPEYLTRPLLPSPPYLGLILACIKQLDKYLALPLERRKQWGGENTSFYKLFSCNHNQCNSCTPTSDESDILSTSDVDTVLVNSPLDAIKDLNINGN